MARDKSANGTGTIVWRSTPRRPFVRVSTRDEHGGVHRPWVDLKRPELKEGDAADLVTAKRAAGKLAKKAARVPFVGRKRATSPAVTVASLEDDWFALLDADANLKPASRAGHKSCWSANIVPRLGAHLVVALTVPVLRGWIRELAEEPLAPSTVRNNANALRRFLADAKAEQWAPLVVNAMKDDEVSAVLPSVQAPDPDAIVRWTRPECEKLLTLATLPHDRFGLYLVALHTGLRAGELRGLTFAHVAGDEAIPHLRIRQQMVLPRPGLPAAMGTPKSRAGRRDVPLHPAALAWLTWWKAEGWTAHFGRERSDDDHVFAVDGGAAGRPRDAELLRDDLVAAGLSPAFVTPAGEREPYDFHATRRTFASLLAAEGVTPDVIGMIEGHAGQTVTERHYSGRSLEMMARAVGMLRLALPQRSGVAPSPASARPEQLSQELSQPQEPPPHTTDNHEPSQVLAPVAQWIEQRFPKPLVVRSTRAGGATHTPSREARRT